MNIEGRAKGNELQGKISSGNYVFNIPIIDKTLSVSGMSADAKVTGERIGNIQEELDNKSDELNEMAATLTQGLKSEGEKQLAQVEKAGAEQKQIIDKALGDVQDEIVDARDVSDGITHDTLGIALRGRFESIDRKFSKIEDDMLGAVMGEITDARVDVDGTVHDTLAISIREQFKKAEAKTDQKANIIKKTVYGPDVSLSDCGDYPLINLQIFGRSVQDGKPTPDTPIEITNCTNTHIVIDTPLQSDNTETLSIEVSRVLSGFPVDTNGNYTDENGQQWICDEIDFEKGKYIQRVYQYTVTDEDKEYLKFTSSSAGNTINLGNQILAKIPKPINLNDQVIVMSNLAKGIRFNSRGNKDFFSVYSGDGYSFYFRDNVNDNTMTLDEFKTKEITISYILAEPIETNLTSQELRDFKKLYTAYPSANIHENDGECSGFCVTYGVDIKSYVDGKIPIVTEEDDGKLLQVVDGAWATVENTKDSGGVSSYNDLTDKPFYTEEVWNELIPETALPFTVNDGTSGFMTTPTTEMLEIYNSEWYKALVLWDGVEYECKSKLYMGKLKAIGNVEFANGTGDSGEPFILLVDDGTIAGEPISVLISVEDTKNQTATATHTIGISFLTEETHPLDSKYLEIVNYSKDTLLLAEQELAFNDVNGQYVSQFDAIDIVSGKEYKVLWDGEEYVYEAAAVDIDGVVAIGDPTTSTPLFVIVVRGENTMIITSSASSTHTVGIIQLGSCKIKQEYIPDSLYTEIDQRIENYINEALGGEY